MSHAMICLGVFMVSNGIIIQNQSIAHAHQTTPFALVTRTQTKAVLVWLCGQQAEVTMWRVIHQTSGGTSIPCFARHPKARPFALSDLLIFTSGFPGWTFRSIVLYYCKRHKTNIKLSARLIESGNRFLYPTFLHLLTLSLSLYILTFESIVLK